MGVSGPASITFIADLYHNNFIADLYMVKVSDECY